MKIKNNYLGAIILFFVFMGLYVRDELVHITLLELSAGEHGFSRYYILGMMLAALLYFFQIQSEGAKTIKLPRAGHVFIYFVLLTYVLSILLSYHSGFALLSDYIVRLLPVFAIYIAYCLMQNTKDVEKIFTLFFCYAVFLGYFYIKVSLQKVSLVMTEETVNSSVYFLLYLLPILLCTKRKLLKYIAIISIGILIVLSAKRGGFVAFLLGLVAYIVVGLLLANKLKFKQILLAVVLLIALGVGINYLKNDESLFLFSRMEGIGDSGYGDRGLIYPKVLEMIFSSDIMGLFWGHGFNSVIKDLSLGYSAHNDFLEIWYDFGIIGILSYLVVWYSVIRFGFRMIKWHSYYAAPYFFMISVLFVNSMISHIFLYNQYFLMFSVTLGLIWSLFQREKREQLYLRQ